MHQWHFIFDNKSAISITHSQVEHDSTKHIEIEIDQYFIKEKLDKKIKIKIRQWSNLYPICLLSRQPRRPSTKVLNSSNFERIVSKLGIENAYSPA